MASLNIKRTFGSLLSRIKQCQKKSNRCLSSAPSVVEVGKPCEKQSADKSYSTGQTFLHTLFDYRGVILYPWVANVYEMDPEKKVASKKKEIFYQALIDDRDLEFARKYLKEEKVTYLPSNNTKGLTAIQGLDYVAHDDILPYTGVDNCPIEHPCLYHFLKYASFQSPHYKGQPNLYKHPWLKVYDVYREISENIKVTVIPAFMGIKDNNYWWRYTIRLENLGTETVQLRHRSWKIYPKPGAPIRKIGRGVVGEEPVLSPDFPFFQYSSHISLQSSSGYMRGNYVMEKQDQTTFKCKIPNFSLESTIDMDINNDTID
ncbi:polymerase delta-interacting protein 2-like [Mytilus galloprovincialis]|uniref:polymerase delta-interacting protein 2-like n=1 Tax=Mytilus galloprovincialis TaxID=29158 RepID=UPI003F7CC406